MEHQTADQPGRDGAVSRLDGTAEGSPAGPAAGRAAEDFFGFGRRIGCSQACNALSGPLLAAVFFWLLLLEFHNLSRAFHLPETYAYDATFHAWLVATISKIMFLSLLVALLLAVQIAFQIQRARNEEGVLSEAFPEYEAYKLRTRRFIPGVY